MQYQQASNYYQDPVFQSAMRNLASGVWEKGLNELDQVLEQHPGIGELRQLREEMELRARMDKYEKEDRREATQRTILRWGFRLTIVLVLLVAVRWSILNYSNWIQSQITSARDRIEVEMQTVELAARFRDGQNLLIAERPEEALVFFEEIKTLDPEYPGLNDAIQQAHTIEGMRDRYENATDLMSDGDYAGALIILKGIAADDPNYKDVGNRIAEIEGQFFLGEIASQADKAYMAEDWEKAVSSYETLRAINPDYKTDMVLNRLYDSYLKAAVESLSADTDSFQMLEISEEYFRRALALKPGDETLRKEREELRDTFKESLSRTYMQAAIEALRDDPDSIEAMASAEDYFQRALTLNPSDGEIRQQRDLARAFIQAQNDYSDSNYDNAIKLLESVIENTPDYANGTARQLLFESYLARGNTLAITGEYETALDDFQLAVVLADQTANPILRKFTAQIKVAEMYGVLGDYDRSVVMYQRAVALFEELDFDLAENANTRARLQEADRYASWNNFRTAYTIYRDVAPTLLLLYNRVTVTVRSDDYLASLANEYNTSIEAILAANQLVGTKEIRPGQELIIPGATE